MTYRSQTKRLVLALAVGALVASCGGKDGSNLLEQLPFGLTRIDQGVLPTEEEIISFTRKITGFWKQVDYFQWVLDTSHGVDAATGLPDWMVWWTGVEVVKQAGEITFRHTETGGPDNIMIPTSKVLAQALSSYLLNGDRAAGRIAEQYSRGITATMLGMVWDQNDPIRSIMARAVITNNHTVTLDDGRTKQIDYTAWRRLTQDWNTHTIHVPNNPFWGDIYVKNMRSKDDVPHLFRTTAFLRYLVERAKDQKLRSAAAEACDYLQGFAKDIVDNDYHIRSKDEEGNLFIPDQDLASFVDYEWLDPNAECTAKLSSALLGYGEPRDNNCQDGYGGAYEMAAVVGHYYNLAIIRNFHMSAVLHALLVGEDDIARELLQGLVDRVDRDFNTPETDLPTQKEEWEAHLAVFLLQSSSCGLPLTSREARLIQQYYGQAVDSLSTFEPWNVWEASVPDGNYNYRPGHYVDIEEIAFFLEHCFSPFRNPASVKVVDCERVKNPARWGEP